MTPLESLRIDFTDRCCQYQHAIETGDLDRAIELRDAINRLLDLAAALPAPVSAATNHERQQEAG